MQKDEAVEGLRALFNLIYKFMKACEMTAFGITFTLWELFLVGMFVGLILFLVYEFFK